MHALLLIAALVFNAPVHAAEPVEVVSTHVEAVSVTIYRDLFALVTETRTVDLPAEAVTLSFEGVVETLIPESVVLAELGRPLEERNYDYDSLSPNNLLRKSIGKTVTLMRTLPGSGKVSQTRAVILSADSSGIVLRTEQGNEALRCSGIPEHLTFDEIPGDLHPRPKLSIHLAAGSPGKRTVHLSYLAQGFAWSSDYVARLDPKGNRMHLRGSVTLRNFTDTNFRAASVQVVAGKLHLLDADDGGTSSIGATDDFESAWELRQARESGLEEMKEDLEDEANGTPFIFSGCHAMPIPQGTRTEARQRIHSINAEHMGELEEVIVTGMRRSIAVAVREELGDYQLYRLPWATDLNARQTKQAVFLDKPDVKIERHYGYRLDAERFENGDTAVLPESVLTFENRKSSGLGEPLPEGMLRLFERMASGDIFAGEAQIDDQPVGVPVEAVVAHAIDLQFDIVVDRGTEEDRHGEEVAEFADVLLSVRNAKPVPVTIELRQILDEDMPNAKIVMSNHRVGRKSGDFAWRFRVAANSADTLTYRLRVPYPDDEDEDSGESD